MPGWAKNKLAEIVRIQGAVEILGNQSEAHLLIIHYVFRLRSVKVDHGHAIGVILVAAVVFAGLVVGSERIHRIDHRK